MLLFDNTREFKIIEAYYKGKLVGKFVDMHTATNQLGVLANKVSYMFTTVVNEKRDEKLFWELIQKGYIINESYRGKHK